MSSHTAYDAWKRWSFIFHREELIVALCDASDIGMHGHLALNCGHGWWEVFRRGQGVMRRGTGTRCSVGVSLHCTCTAGLLGLGMLAYLSMSYVSVCGLPVQWSRCVEKMCEKVCSIMIISWPYRHAHHSVQSSTRAVSHPF